MLMQTITLCDRVTVRLDAGRWWADGSNMLPHDERNLALRAARVFCRAADIPSDGMEITLEKQIPTCAGLGGGSADAAAVLRALQRHYGSPLSMQRCWTRRPRWALTCPSAWWAGRCWPRDAANG